MWGLCSHTTMAERGSFGAAARESEHNLSLSTTERKTWLRYIFATKLWYKTCY